MATLTDADLKNRLEHGVWLDEIDRSFRDWRAAPNADKPQFLLSGMMLTWAEGWRMTNPNDFSPAVHTFISRSVQAQAAKSSAEREAKTADIQRRDRVYQQILLLMALFAIVLLAPAAIRQSLVGPEQVAVAPEGEPEQTRPAATAAAVTVTQELPQDSLTGARPVDSWASSRLFDRARREGSAASKLGPIFALEALAARAIPGDINHTNVKWVESALSLTAEMTRIQSDHALLPQSGAVVTSLETCGSRRLGARLEGGGVAIADFARGRAVTRPGDPEVAILPTAMDRDCTVGVAANLDHEILLVALDDPSAAPRRIGSHDAPIASAAISANADRAVTVARDGVAKVWDIRSARLLRTLSSQDDHFAGATLSPDGAMVVTWTDRPGAVLWTVATGAAAGRLGGHDSRLVDAQFVKDGAQMLTTSIDGTAILWSTASFERLATLRPKGGSILRAWTTVDASRIIAQLDGDRVQVWRVGGSTPLADLAPGDGKTRLVAADPAGTIIATADAAGATTVWDATTGARLLTLNQGGIPLKSLMISEDAASVIGIAETQVLSWALPRTLDAAATMLVALGGCADQASRDSHKLAGGPPAACPSAFTGGDANE